MRSSHAQVAGARLSSSWSGRDSGRDVLGEQLRSIIFCPSHEVGGSWMSGARLFISYIYVNKTTCKLIVARMLTA